MIELERIGAVVEKINEELFEQLVVDYEDDFYFTQLQIRCNGYDFIVEYLGDIVYNSDECDYDEDDNLIDAEIVIREKMNFINGMISNIKI